MLISDDNPHRDTLHVTYCLMGVCFLFFLWCVIDPHYQTAFLESESYYQHHGARRLRGAWRRSLRAMTPEGRAIASAFVQFAVNAFTLWMFGDNIEYAMGRLRYILFVVIMFAVTLYVPMMLHPGVGVAHIAMNGVLAAVLGAYARIFPQQKIEILVYVPSRTWRIFSDTDDPVEWRAIYFVLVFFAFNIVATYWMPYRPNTMVYLEHVVGVVLGYLCAPLFRDPYTVLMERGDITAVAQPPTLAENHWSYLRKFKTGEAKDPTDGIRPSAQTPTAREKSDPDRMPMDF